MVSTVDSRQFSIQYYSSGKDLKQNFGASGGLRQFVDHLTRSLNRRVVVCEIAELSMVYGIHPPTRVETVLGYGVAVCSPEDTFSFEYGRGLALYRAMKNVRCPQNTRLSSRERDLLAFDEGFVSFTSLKKRFCSNVSVSPSGPLLHYHMDDVRLINVCPTTLESIRPTANGETPVGVRTTDHHSVSDDPQSRSDDKLSVLTDLVIIMCDGSESCPLCKICPPSRIIPPFITAHDPGDETD